MDTDTEAPPRTPAPSAGAVAAGAPLPRPPARRQPNLLRRGFSDPVSMLDELAAAHGPNFGLGAGPVRLAVLGEPAAIRELFRMPTDHFRWGHKFNVLGFVVGDGSLIVADGEEHRRKRASIQRAFSRRRLVGWIPMIVGRTDHAVDELVRSLDAGGRVVDLYHVGRSLVLDVVIRALFGERLAARAGEIGDRFQSAQDYLESPAFRQLPHPFPYTRRARVRADRRALDAIIDDQIAHLRSSPDDHDPRDVLASLVDDSTLTDDEIRDQVVTLLGAGFDTTAASLAWLLWCATLSPGLWERLRAEADDVLGPPGGGASEPPDHETLASLVVAERTMRETTRLHPAGVVSPREAARDLVVGGYRIREGTLILWSPHLAGRHAATWHDPETFDPDRFADLTEEQRALADMAWVPFGGGARNCVGFALAQMELTLIVSRLAQRLDLAPTQPTAPRAVGMVVNRPEGGAPMHVTPRGR